MSAIEMSDLLRPERVIPTLRAADKSTVLRELSAHIAKDAAVPEEAIRDGLLITADLPPFMPRGGISLLHTLVHGMERPMAALARLERPINLGAPDECPTDVVVLLASPAQKPQDHLRALACVARRLRRRDVCEHLRAAKSRDAMFVALVSDEWCASGVREGAAAWPRERTTGTRR